MVKRLHPIGHSYGLILDRTLLDMVGGGPDTLFDVTTDGKTLTLRPVDRSEHKAKVRASTKRMTKIHDAAFRALAE